MFLTDEFFMLRVAVDFDIHVNDKDFFVIIQTVKGKDCKIWCGRDLLLLMIHE